MKKLTEYTDLRPISGKWEDRDALRIENIKRQEVYRSPEEPSYVAWCILWRNPDGRLMLSFMEATGREGLWPPTFCFTGGGVSCSLKTLVSEDEGNTWQDTGWREPADPLWVRNSDHHIRRVLCAEDGRLLRIYPHTREDRLHSAVCNFYDPEKAGEVYPLRQETREVHPKSATVWQSTDGGESWEEIFRFEDCFLSGFRRLSGGELVGVGVRMPENGFERPVPVITESADGGFHWCEPYPLTDEEGLPISGCYTEEADLAELPGGRLFLLWRTAGEDLQNRQMLLERNSIGKWQVSGKPESSALSRYNYPFLCPTSDGVLFLSNFTDRIDYSVDHGKSWESFPTGPNYYGQLLEVRPGRMLIAAHDDLDDNPYPSYCDLSVCVTGFDYRKCRMWEQKDASVPIARCFCGEESHADFHLRTELRTNGSSGIFYAAKEDGFHFAAVVLPEQEGQTSRLILGHSDGRTLTPDRQVSLFWGGGQADPDRWTELQLCRKDGLLTAAVRLPGGKVQYLRREDNASAGKIGIFTCSSTGAFRDVCFSREPLSIRENMPPEE